MEQWMKKIEADKKSASAQLDLEKLYSISVAEQWLEMNVKDEAEGRRKRTALRSILYSEEYQRARELSKEISRCKTDDPALRKEAAECIAKLAQSRVYLENVSDAGYKLLDKYKYPETYKTDAFVTHSNIMTALCDYLFELG